MALDINLRKECRLLRNLIVIANSPRVIYYLNIYIYTPDFTKYSVNDVKLRLRYKDLVNFARYPITYPDRTTTFAKHPPLLTQLGGMGMMELESERRREMVERQKDDMIREIATTTGQLARMMRSIIRRANNAPTDNLTDDRRNDI